MLSERHYLRVFTNAISGEEDTFIPAKEVIQRRLFRDIKAERSFLQVFFGKTLVRIVLSDTISSSNAARLSLLETNAKCTYNIYIVPSGSRFQGAGFFVQLASSFFTIGCG